MRPARLVSGAWEVVQNRPLASNPDYRHLVFNAPEIARRAQAGQFLMVRPSSRGGLILPRPFSIYQADRATGRVGILFKVLRDGTQMIAAREAGERLEAFGPLGRGFAASGFPAGAAKGTGVLLLVGGGYGVGPMILLARQLLAGGWAKKRLAAFVGARDRRSLLGQDEFKRMGLRCVISTDDGSVGVQGRVTDAIRRTLAKAPPPPGSFVCACGPNVMLKAVAAQAGEMGLRAWVSIEELMGCGTGVCLSCVCRIRGQGEELRQALVCKDGPVFEGPEVVWAA